MIDTLRIILFWECNLSCKYCCNEIPEIRDKIESVALKDINFKDYKNICISGGEPFLDSKKVYNMLSKFSNDTYIYTNGMLMDIMDIHFIQDFHPHVKGINMGLHYPKTFTKLIDKFKDYSLVRFHVQDIHKEDMLALYPDVNFHFWVMNECDTPNERIIILKE